MSYLNKRIKNLSEQISGNIKLKGELEKLIDQEEDINKKLFTLILSKYGTKVPVTDLAIITNTYNVKDDSGTHAIGAIRMGDTNTFIDLSGEIKVYNDTFFSDDYFTLFHYGYMRNYAIRPFINDKRLYKIALKRKRIDENGFLVCSLGEYPQMLVSKKTQRIIKNLIKKGEYTETGIFHKIYSYDELFQEIGFYIDGVFRKFINVPVEYAINEKLSKNEKSVLIEVTPVEWIIDTESETLISKYGLIGNVPNEDVYDFYNNHLLKDIFAHLDHDEKEQLEVLSLTTSEYKPGIDTTKLLSSFGDELAKLFDSAMDDLSDEIKMDGKLLLGVMRYERLIEKKHIKK